jgi:outer membrane immunogenic protein
MKSVWGFVCAIVSAFIIIPAMAADLPVKAPIMKAPPPPVYNWTGCYIAGGGGYGLYDVEHFTTSPGPLFGVAQEQDNGGRGWFGTVGGGCDLQFASPFGGSAPFFGGQWVIGILGDFDFMRIRGNYTVNCPLGCVGPFSLTGQANESSAGYIGARLGWVVVPQLLAYVDGGWTETRFDSATLTDTFGSASTVGIPAQTFNGWFFGGGTEYAIGWLPGLYWRNEYRFSQYQQKSTAVACIIGACNTVPGINSIDNAKPFVQTVRSELVWRFNWFGGAPVMSRY